MGVSRWHHYHFAGSDGEEFAIDSDLSLSVENLHNSIEWSGMFAETLPCIEREYADASIGVFHKLTTDNSIGGIINDVCQVHYFFCFHIFICHTMLNMSLLTPQMGQHQSVGSASNGVPGAMPLSGSPLAGS